MKTPTAPASQEDRSDPSTQLDRRIALRQGVGRVSSEKLLGTLQELEIEHARSAIAYVSRPPGNSFSQNRPQSACRSVRQSEWMRMDENGWGLHTVGGVRQSALQQMLEQKLGSQSATKAGKP